MRLEKKKDEELAAREGMAGKTIIAFIWLTISAVAAYFLVKYMFDTSTLRYSTFYSLGLPSQVPNWVILVGMIILVVAIMQSFLMFGFMLASPEGRRRTGDASLHSRSKDPLDDHSGRG